MGARQKATFKLTIMTPDALIYQKEVESVFFTGDRGEYELLPYHYPVLGILKDRSDRTPLQDFTLREDHHLIGHMLHHTEVMRNQKKRNFE
jgi:hypothetical protein